MHRISRDAKENRLSPVESFQWLGAILLVGLALPFTFRDGLIAMVESWSTAEYSHGYVIPVIALLLVWQKAPELARAKVSGAWFGAIVVCAGILVLFVGELGTVYTLIQYGFLVTLSGFVLAAVGWHGLRIIWAPLVYLFFAVPLPAFFYSRLSIEMQLIASEWGVAIIRLFDISVFLDGNIIDLGIYQLQVVEACDGLRYLFPLMSFGFLLAYLVKGPLWHRAIIFVSTIPITILMNSFRIGVTGILVEHFGIKVAEGFLHDFQGWIIFMACVAVLFGEIWLLNMSSRSRRPLGDLIALGLPRIALRTLAVRYRSPPRAISASIVILLLAAAGSMAVAQRAEALPDREDFVSFPLQLDEWRGQRVPVEKSIIYAIKVDDWIMTAFTRPQDAAFVNFYVAYYASQRKGASAHSPQSCIPGGGWRIEELSEKSIPGILPGGAHLTVKRAIIGKGQVRQVVYYWFQQRDRMLTNEYLVKWYLLWDAVTRNRTDGALVRVMTRLSDGEETVQADQRLSEFIRAVYSPLRRYLPST